jgi:alpha-galactosidase
MDIQLSKITIFLTNLDHCLASEFLLTTFPMGFNSWYTEYFENFDWKLFGGYVKLFSKYSADLELLPIEIIVCWHRSDS